jgi:hypothetical protein
MQRRVLHPQMIAGSDAGSRRSASASRAAARTSGCGSTSAPTIRAVCDRATAAVRARAARGRGATTRRWSGSGIGVREQRTSR